MAGWRVIRNDLPALISRLSDELDAAVQNTADELAQDLSTRVWRRTGMISRHSEVYDTALMRASVAVGWVGGKGFYSGFQEFGTRRQAARPIVAPTAVEYEQIFASNTEEAIRRAAQ